MRAPYSEADLEKEGDHILKMGRGGGHISRIVCAGKVVRLLS
jgi:hypothetical protein